MEQGVAVSHLKQRYRLKKNEDFQRVRSEGRSWAHPLAVLCALRNDREHNRFGFAVSRRIGKAVERNRAKRLLREVVRLRQSEIVSGWDLVLIARPAIRGAGFSKVDQAVETLFKRAQLVDWDSQEEKVNEKDRTSSN